MKKQTKKPVIGLVSREIINGYLFDLKGIQLPKNGYIDIYESIEAFSDNDLPIGKAKVVVKYGKLIAQLEELDEVYYDRYLYPVITNKSIDANFQYVEVLTSKIDLLVALDGKYVDQTNLSIQDQIANKNHIQDFFTVERINELCAKYDVGVLEISDYTGIQYNSLYQYLGGEKSKPVLPLSKVVKAALFLYFKAVFNHVE